MRKRLLPIVVVVIVLSRLEIGAATGQPDNCFCTYNPANPFLVAFVNEASLQNGGLIRKGETVELFCKTLNRNLLWPNGMRMYQSATLTCDVCQTWGSSELPSCDLTQTGDFFIRVDGTMKILPGGAIEYQSGKQLILPCVNFDDNSYPEWHLEVPHSLELQQSQLTHKASLIIPEMSRRYTGIYKCSTRNLDQQRHRATKVELRMQANPVVSHLEEQKATSVVPLGDAAPNSPDSKEPSVEENIICIYTNEDRRLLALANGIQLRHGDSVKKDDSVELSCRNQAMQLVLPNGTEVEYGIVMLTCNYSVTWNAIDLPTCEAVHRPANPVVSVSEEQKDTSVVPSGDAAPNSPSSKEPSLEENITCIYNKADRKLSALVNGIWLRYGDRVKKYDSVELSCRNQAMQLVLPNGTKVESGILKLICNNSVTWEANDLPSCEAAHRPDILCPPIDDKNVFNIVYNNGRKANSTAHFSCKDVNQNIARGSDIWTCLPTGSWSGGIPQCKVFSTGVCSAPLVQNGSIQEQDQFGYERGGWNDSNVSVDSLSSDNATFLLVCDEDHSFKKAGVSSVEITCSNGQWSPDPVCLKNDIICPPIDEKDVFIVVYNDGRKISSTARFYCKDVKQEIVGGSTLTCLPTGNWSGGIPECKVSQCAIKDLLEKDPEILVDNLKSEYGEMVPAGVELSLRCRGNLILVGSPKAKCGRKGKWSYGSKCVSGCHLDLNSLPPQLIVDPVKQTFIFGEYLDLSCPLGMKLTSKVEMLMCMGSRWSDKIPECQ